MIADRIGFLLTCCVSIKKIVVPKAPPATSVHVKRSMKGNKGKDTKPELVLRSALHKAGLRFRIHYNIIGKPDIVFPSRKHAVFVDGCYWHGCPKCFRKPNSNKDYWQKKISRNQQRAKTVNRQLNRQGWSVFRVWEHDVIKNIDKPLEKISKRIG